MKPYYDDGKIQIYNGDCREIIPDLGTFDLVCTDPPYNCGKDYDVHDDSMTDEKYESWAQGIVSALLAKAANQFWVAPRYKMALWSRLIPNAHLVVVPRGAAGPFRQGWSDQFETALTLGKPNKPISDLWNGIRLKGEGYFFTEETFGHPGCTPFPIIMKAVTHLSKESVLEPFCGTGTTLRAAKDLGRRAVGIEISEAYCEIAARRLQQEVMV